jgi:hypothetical protein
MRLANDEKGEHRPMAAEGTIGKAVAQAVQADGLVDLGQARSRAGLCPKPSNIGSKLEFPMPQSHTPRCLWLLHDRETHATMLSDT